MNPPLNFGNMPLLENKPVETAAPMVQRAQLFVPAEHAEEVKSTLKKSLFSNVKEKFKDLLSGKETYVREQVAPTIVAPTVAATTKDLYSTYHTLDTGTQVRVPPSRLKATIDTVYSSNPELPKGILEAMLMKESSMGADATNKNSSIGEYAYLVGFTPVAKSELIRNGIVPDLNTPQGVLQATADYIKLKKDIKDATGKVVHTYDNWTKFYNERYSSGKLKPEDIKKFDDMMKYYSNQSSSNGSQGLFVPSKPTKQSRVNTVVGGVDIASYATDPKHEQKIASIMSSIGDVSTSTAINSYIKKVAPLSPLNGEMVKRAADKYKIAPSLLLAIIQNDSSFGTKGKAVRTKNAGNYGNDDAGNEMTFKNWEDGLFAVAKWLDKHRVA